jgi:N-methylhydantoinase A
MSDEARYRIGIDVGGTFTDFLVVDEDGSTDLSKTLSTDPPTAGVFAGLERVAASRGIDLETLLARVSHIVHGTTITTNAVLTGRGARTAFLTTEGFRDMLQMRRGIKAGNQYEYDVPQPPPLIERRHVHEIPERVNSRGAPVVALDEDAVLRVAQQARADGAEAVAVSYLWSFANPGHEQRTAELLREALPGVYVSLSSEVIPQLRVYERSSTTALNAYVGPVLARYLNELGDRLGAAGFAGTLLIMQSNGGAMSPELSARFAVNTLLSGPAGGPAAGVSYGALHVIDDLITIDMGGTSFDVALVERGTAVTTTDGDIAGHRVALPALDIHTIGAGGGSIARVDEGGLLAVGPQSAGSSPGPACYGRGGTQPTVTDADLLLGYLDPALFAGGDIPLDVDAAREAMAREVAEPLGLSVEQAAQGVCTLVNTTMANAVRFISVERGKDPREFALVVAGGAGPLHAAPIAGELGIPLVLIPRESSVFCAAGMVISDIKHDYVRTLTRPLDAAAVEEANGILAEMAREARDTLRAEAVEDGDITVTASADLHYIGQFHEVEVEAGGEVLDRDALEAGFHARHQELFGHAVPGAPLELINVRVRSVGATSKPSFPLRPNAGADPSAARKGERAAIFDGAPHATPVYDGLALRHGNRLDGPALVEQPTTTIVVPPGFALQCDQYDNYLLHAVDLSLDDALERLRAHAVPASIGA